MNESCHTHEYVTPCTHQPPSHPPIEQFLTTRTRTQTRAHKNTRIQLRTTATPQTATLDDATLAANSTTVAANSTLRNAQQQKEEDQNAYTKSLDSLRILREDKLKSGETVFFDFPAIIGGEEGMPEECAKPLLLFLTGMDGLGVSAEPQFRDLSRLFEVRRLQVY